MPEIFAIASCSSRSIRADYISDRPIPSLQYWWGVQTNLGESPTRYSRGAVCHCFRLETPRIDWIQITYFLFDANDRFALLAWSMSSRPMPKLQMFLNVSGLQREKRVVKVGA